MRAVLLSGRVIVSGLLTHERAAGPGLLRSGQPDMGNPEEDAGCVWHSTGTAEIDV